MTRIETTREILGFLGNEESDRRAGNEHPASHGTLMAEKVATLGRRIAEAAALGPVEVVTVD